MTQREIDFQELGLIGAIEFCQLIEKELTTSTSVSIGQQSKLEDRRVRSIIAAKSGVTEEGKTIADPSNAYLHLVEVNGSEEFIVIPLRNLMYDPATGAYPLQQGVALGGRRFDWTASKIKFGTAPTAGTVLQLLVIADRQPIIKK